MLFKIVYSRTCEIRHPLGNEKKSDYTVQFYCPMPVMIENNVGLWNVEVFRITQVSDYGGSTVFINFDPCSALPIDMRKRKNLRLLHFLILCKEEWN